MKQIIKLKSQCGDADLITKMGFLVFLQRVFFPFFQGNIKYNPVNLWSRLKYEKNTISKRLHLKSDSCIGLQWIIVTCIYYKAILKAFLNIDRQPNLY